MVSNVNLHPYSVAAALDEEREADLAALAAEMDLEIEKVRKEVVDLEAQLADKEVQLTAALSEVRRCKLDPSLKAPGFNV